MLSLRIARIAARAAAADCTGTFPPRSSASPNGSNCRTRDLQAKIGRARHQLLVFLAQCGAVEPTNNGSERLPRPSVVHRKVTNGYRAMWAAEGEADIRTVGDAARLTGSTSFGTILKTGGA